MSKKPVIPYIALVWKIMGQDCFYEPELPGILTELIESLHNERVAQVLKLRFGLEDGQSRTLEQVGAKIGVSRERIRQIEGWGLRKLRHPSYSSLLRPYVLSGIVRSIVQPQLAELRDTLAEANALLRDKVLPALVNRKFGTDPFLLWASQLPLSSLPADTGARHALGRYGLKNVAEVAVLNDEELLNIRNLGAKKHAAIKEGLRQLHREFDQLVAANDQ